MIKKVLNVYVVLLIFLLGYFCGIHNAKQEKSMSEIAWAGGVVKITETYPGATWMYITFNKEIKWSKEKDKNRIFVAFKDN